MSNATAVAPERATKAPKRGKAAPAPAPAAQKQARPPLSEDDYRAIAIGSQICSLLMPIVDGPFGVDRVIGFHHISDAESHAWDLHSIEKEWTEDGPPPTVHDLVLLIHSHLHLAIAEIGASQDTSNAPMMYCVRLLVGEAFQLARELQEAYLGLPATRASLAALTNKLQQPGTAATAIEAGARQYRDRPTPPIRRVEDDSEDMGRSALTRKQLLCVLEVAASNLATIDNILMQAQTEPDSWALSGLVDAAQALTRHCGGMVDTAAGAGILGGHDRWNFGPNFADLGKAGAA